MAQSTSGSGKGTSIKKNKPEKKMKSKECSSCGETQHNIPKSYKEDKKVKPKEVFGSNYKDKKKKNKK